MENKGFDSHIDKTFNRTAFIQKKLIFMTKGIEEELLDPASYPQPPGDVELVQTHISYVFIGREFVYKVKKPVDFGFLDFSTLEKRKYYCEQELELNKRLSPDIYLDVVPITDQGETLFLGGDGEIVDYAVRMKRIPMDKLMKDLLKEGRLTEEMITDLAHKIADFHKIAEGSDKIEKFGTIEVVKGNTDENFEQTEKYKDISITQPQFDDIQDYTNDFYNKESAEFQKRIDEGRIKDCHGDLHMEHICFTDPISIFDCIEFNERFRFSDTAADLAFLVMDLDYNGRNDLSMVLVDAYIEASGDAGIRKMIDFYKVYRAYVRGKVISFRLDDPHITDVDKEEAKANGRKYFELAHSYVKELNGDILREPFAEFIKSELNPGTLLIACGLPGTWKTETTQEVSKIKGYPILRTDIIRLEVLSKEEIFDEKEAANMDKRKMVYDEMFRQAEEAVLTGDGVILDATFVTRELRIRAATIAAKNKKTFVILQTNCPDEVAIGRILRRTKENYESNALTEVAFINNKKKFEKPDLDILKDLLPDLNVVHLTVDTSSDPSGDWHIIGKETR